MIQKLYTPFTWVSDKTRTRLAGLAAALLLAPAAAWAQAPANDDCAGAVTLTPGATCTTTAGTTVGATQSQAPIACNGFTSSNAADVWYKFVATGTTHVITVASPFDGVLESFSGSCTALISMGCADDAVSNGSETMTMTGLTVGSTYYFRYYGYTSGTTPNNGTLTACVTGAPAVPANDNCAGAITLTAGATCTPVNGTTAGSTQSQPAGACNGSTSGTANDVWYRFVATGTTHALTFASGFDGIIEAYSGACGTLTAIGCADAAGSNSSETVTLTGLTVGSTYYARYYAYTSGTTPATGAFTACLTTPATAPANDDCSGAVTLTPGATCTPTNGTVTGATQSQAAVACSGFTSPSARDVWYRFTATSTAHTITFAGGFDGVMEVFSGACGSLTSIACGDASVNAGETLTLSTLTAGAQYYVRYYPYGAAATTTPNFTVCVQTVPANDAAVLAIYTLGKAPVGSPVTVQAVIRNAGSATITGVPVTLSVTGVSPTTNSQLTGSIAPGATATVTFTAYTPATAGNNTLTVSLLADDVLTNNTLTYNQVVTSNTFSYANNTAFDPALSVGFGATSNSAFVARFTTPVDRTLTAVTAGIGGTAGATTPNPTIGNTVYGVAYSATGALLGRSPNYVITAADISTRKTFTFSTPINLPANTTFHVGMVQTPAVGSRYFPMATLPQNPTMASTFFTVAAAGGTLNDAAASNLGIFVIEAVADRVTGTSEALNRAVSLYPNPTSNGQVTLDVRGAKAQGALEVQVINTLGQTVHTALLRDNFENKLNLSQLASGMYILKVKSGDEFTVRHLSLTK